MKVTPGVLGRGMEAPGLLLLTRDELTSSPKAAWMALANKEKILTVNGIWGKVFAEGSSPEA